MIRSIILWAAQKTSVFGDPWTSDSCDRTAEYSSRSHLWGKSFKPKRFNRTDLFEGDTSRAMPDIAAHRHQLDLVGWGMQPADDDMGFSLAFRGYIQLSHLARGQQRMPQHPVAG